MKTIDERIKEIAQENLWPFVEIYQIKKDLENKTCRTCEYRERWQCGGRVIQYCGRRKSNRTFNHLLKIKVTTPACGLFKEAQL